jgi:hypothetical protein
MQCAESFSVKHCRHATGTAIVEKAGMPTTSCVHLCAMPNGQLVGHMLSHKIAQPHAHVLVDFADV